VNQHRIDLVRGKAATVNNVTLTENVYSSNDIKIGRAGLFVVIYVPEYGMEVMWDEGKHYFLALILTF